MYPPWTLEDSLVELTLLSLTAGTAVRSLEQKFQIKHFGIAFIASFFGYIGLAIGIGLILNPSNTGRIHVEHILTLILLFMALGAGILSRKAKPELKWQVFSVSFASIFGLVLIMLGIAKVFGNTR